MKFGFRKPKEETRPERKPVGERLENIRMNWNKVRRFLNIDTSKSRW